VSKYAVNGKEPIAAWIPSRDTTGNGTTTLTDLVGSNNGTLTNMDAATDWAADTGAGGVRALDFDGNNDEVLFSSVFSTMPFSISLWAYPRSIIANQHVFSIGSSISNNQLFTIAFRGDLSGDPIAAQMRGSDGNITSWAQSPGAYSVNTWTHVLAVFSATNSRQIFINGVAGTADTTSHNVQAFNRMAIGSLARISSALFFNGLVDDVRIFNQGLVLADAQYLAQRRAITKGGIIPILRQHYAAQGAR
jgi:hypothetical protein